VSRDERPAAREWRAWTGAGLVFVLCLPPAFVVGITLIGHARGLPYVSPWVDRLVLAASVLGLPSLAAFGVHRLLRRRDVHPDGERRRPREDDSWSGS